MQFAQVRLHTSQLAAQRAFYSEILGLPVVDSSDTAFTLQIGTSRLTFEQGHDDATYHFAFNIPENQIEAGAQWLEQFVPLLTLNDQKIFNFVSWNGHSVYFFDPAGNIGELIARHGLSNASEAEFGAHSWLNVSEVGLVTTDVRAIVAQLQADLDLPVYDGEGSDSFTAVGDEAGLLIVVSAGRIWYPETGLVAGIFPTTIQLASGQHLHADTNLTITT